MSSHRPPKKVLFTCCISTMTSICLRNHSKSDARNDGGAMVNKFNTGQGQWFWFLLGERNLKGAISHRMRSKSMGPHGAHDGVCTVKNPFYTKKSVAPAKLPGIRHPQVSAKSEPKGS